MPTINGTAIKKVVVACDAGMGSSVMLASQLKRQLAKSNVTVEHKRDGRTVAFTYDANNRLTIKTLADNTFSDDVVYDYDLRGLTRATCFARIEWGDDELDDDCATSGQGETNTFDGFGNLTERTSRMAGVSRTLTYRTATTSKATARASRIRMDTSSNTASMV